MAARDEPASLRASNVARALAGIEQKFGVGALQRLCDVPKPTSDVLGTGLADLDRLTGIGGWPRGRICEVFGSESVGVTTLLVQTLAAAQQHGGIVAFVDVDRAFVPEYARRLGCVVEDIFIAQPDDGPMALEIVDALVRSGAFDAIVLDSVPALYSHVRDQEAVDAPNESLERARLLSDAMRRLAANVDRPRTVVLFGNRRAERADSHVEDGATPGGRALRFYSSIRLGMERRDVVQGALGATGTGGQTHHREEQGGTATSLLRDSTRLRARVREPVAVEQVEVGCPVGAGDLAHRLRTLHRHKSRSAWTVTNLVEHGFLAFASAEHYGPAEQYRVETVEHNRRRDQKLLDAQAVDEIRPHDGLEDEAEAPDDVAEADCVLEPGRTLPAVVHPSQPGRVVASHEIPGEKEAERTWQQIRNDECQPNSGGDERLANQVQTRIAAECYERNCQTDSKQDESGQEIDPPPAHDAQQRVQ